MSDSRQAETGVVVLAHATLRRVLVAATAIVVALGIVREVFVATIGSDTLLKDLRHIALNSEHCLGAWYSSLLMLFASALFGAIAYLERRDREQHVWHWRGLCVVFALLAADEMLAVHELTSRPLRSGLGVDGFLHFAWVVPAGLLVAAFALAYLPFLLRIRRQTALGMVAAGTIFITGALGVEMIGGWALTAEGEDSVAYMIAFIVEETLEMIGVAVLIVVLARHVSSVWPTASFAFG